jgi:hypothetical protein
MAKPITVTVPQLRAVLAGVTHATPFSATTLTNAGAKKGGNELGEVYKLTRINGMTGAIYSNAILKQQSREGIEQPSFVAQPRSWGVRIAPALVEHKGDHFLPAQLNPTLKPTDPLPPQLGYPMPAFRRERAFRSYA